MSLHKEKKKYYPENANRMRHTESVRKNNNLVVSISIRLSYYIKLNIYCDFFHFILMKDMIRLMPSEVKIKPTKRKGRQSDLCEQRRKQ